MAAEAKQRWSEERPPFARTVRQAAKELNVQRRLIRNLIAMGQIPHYRVGDRVFVDVLAVRAYLARTR